MKHSSESLETKFFYRLVKVSYVLGCLVTGCAVLVVGYVINKPIRSVDYDKSSVQCLVIDPLKWNILDQDLANQFRESAIAKGADSVETDQYIAKRQNEVRYGMAAYSFSTAGIMTVSNNGALSNDDEIAVRKLCLYGLLNDYSDRYRSLEVPKNRNYQLNIVNRTTGGWSWIVCSWLIGLVVMYVALNISRETLLYIFIGKSFSWDWLQTIIRNY